MNNRVKIISLFFQELSRFCDYAILHHVGNIFDFNSDIDFICGCNKVEVLCFINKFVSKKNLLLVSFFTIDVDTYRFDILYVGDNGLEKIELDCVCNTEQKDLLAIDCRSLLERKIKVRVKNSMFYKINNQDEVGFYVKKKALKAEGIKEHIEYLKALDSSFTTSSLTSDYNEWRSYFGSKLFRLKYIENKVRLLLSRVKENPSLTIAFLGPDGSGKSTIIDELLSAPFFINKYYFHLKPIHSDEHSEIVVDPHKLAVYSKIKSYLKLIFFIYQYNIGWLMNILKLKIKSSLIIFDRYYDDLLIDKKRFRYGGKTKIAKFVQKFIPKPDFYFVLSGDAELIYNRKKEVPFSELQRQLTLYESLSRENKYIMIKVDKEKDEVIKEVIGIIAKVMNKRYISQK